MRILLDTCAIIWGISDPDRLTMKARKNLEDPQNEIIVSPISCAEIACAVSAKKLEIDRHWKLWFRHFIELNGWDSIPIDLPIVEESYSLPGTFHKDPADRIIVATARLFNCPVITADQKILNYPHCLSIW